MGLTDLITQYLLQSLSASDGVVELKRRELAERFGCAPSQINYVLSTRFSTGHGYIVESRRGGGGYVRITRVVVEKGDLTMHAVNAVGDEIDFNSANAILGNLVSSEILLPKLAEIISEALTDSALRPVEAEQRDFVRAEILKKTLVRAIKLQNEME